LNTSNDLSDELSLTLEMVLIAGAHTPAELAIVISPSEQDISLDSISGSQMKPSEQSASVEHLSIKLLYFFDPISEFFAFINASLLSLAGAESSPWIT